VRLFFAGVKMHNVADISKKMAGHFVTVAATKERKRSRQCLIVGSNPALLLLIYKNDLLLLVFEETNVNF
jgi:hypothetical protein